MINASLILRVVVASPSRHQTGRKWGAGRGNEICDVGRIARGNDGVFEHSAVTPATPNPLRICSSDLR